jgi:hypothetical protein
MGRRRRAPDDMSAPPELIRQALTAGFLATRAMGVTNEEAACS